MFPYPTEDWTVDDLAQAAKELTVKKGRKVVQAGYQPNYGDPYFRNPGLYAPGGTPESYPLIKPKTANFADPLVTRSTCNKQFWDMAKSGSAMSMGALLSGGGVNGFYTYGIQNRLAAMKIEGPWFMPQMTGSLAVTKGGIPFDVVSHPHAKQWHAPSGVSRSYHRYPEQECRSRLGTDQIYH